jgi:hypothetical protein
VLLRTRLQATRFWRLRDAYRLDVIRLEQVETGCDDCQLSLYLTLHIRCDCMQTAKMKGSRLWTPRTACQETPLESWRYGATVQGLHDVRLHHQRDVVLVEYFHVIGVFLPLTLLVSVCYHVFAVSWIRVSCSSLWSRAIGLLCVLQRFCCYLHQFNTTILLNFLWYHGIIKYYFII